MSTAALKDLNKLNTFVRVAERRSFTKAAADLRTTPSVVSNRMKELEDSLGFRLLNRSTHGVVLTAAGEGLLRHCQAMLSAIESYVIVARNIHAGPIGTLRIQSTSNYARWILAPLIREFAAKYPTLKVHLSSVPDDCTLVEDGIDVAVATRRLSAPGLVSEELAGNPYVVCASATYLATAGAPTEPQDLRQHNCLINFFSGPNEWPFKVGGRMEMVPVSGSLSSNSYAVLIELALGGCGIVRVPRHAVVDELQDGRLEPLLDKKVVSQERIVVCYSKDKNLPAKTAEFVDFLKASFRRG